MSVKIISGKFKGASLEVPESARATLGRARQSLFDMLEASGIDREVGHFFESKTVLDCFAGSGAVGIEALSRGAKHAYLVDINSDTVKTIHKNLARILKGDASSATMICSDINKIKTCPEEKGCDFIFMDPPFHEPIDIQRILKNLISKGWIGKKSIVTIESAARSLQQTSQVFVGFESILKRKIGSIFLEVFSASM